MASEEIKDKAHSLESFEKMKLVLCDEIKDQKWNELRTIFLDPTEFVSHKTKKWTFGRSLQADILIEDINVSRKHLDIQWTLLESGGQTWTVTDNKSLNGVILNEKKIKPNEEVALKKGDVLSLNIVPGSPHRWTINIDVSLPSAETPKTREAQEAPKRKNENDSEAPASKRVKTSDPGCEIERDPGKAETNGSKTIGESKPAQNPDQKNFSGKSEELHAEKKASSAKDDAGELKSNNEIHQKNGEEAKKEQSEQPKLANETNQSSPSKRVIEKLKTKFTEELSCTVCNEVFISPMTMPCGHVFCKFCLEQWKKQCQNTQYSCPNCREKVGRLKVVPNLYLENLISSWTEDLGPDMLAARQKAIEERKGEEEERDMKEKEKEQNRAKRKRGGLTRPRNNISSSSDTPRSRITYFLTSRSRGEQSGTSNTETSEGESESRYNLRSNQPSENEVITVSSDSSSSDDSSDSDSSDSSSSVEGICGYYYGGYGRCYKCDRRGHWANGCPFD